MRLALTVLGADGTSRADVRVEADAGATVRAVASALREALHESPREAPHRGPRESTRESPRGKRAPGERQLAVVLPYPGTPRPDVPESDGPRPDGLWLDGRRLDDDAPAAALLRDGAVVALGPVLAAATSLAEPRGVTEIRVTGGPAAGTVHRLGLGTATVEAVAVTVGPAGTTVRPEPGPGTGSGIGSELLLDDAPVTEETPWPVGGVLRLGEAVLTRCVPEEPDAALAPAEDGGLAYNRPPRLLPPRRNRRLVVPQEPKKGEGPRLQLLAALLPAVLGLGMVLFTRQWYYLLFALLTPLMMFGSHISESRFGRKKHRRAMREYTEARQAYTTDLEQLRVLDEAERRAASPDPAAVLLTATGPRRRLWERRIDDPDTLQLRLGVADLPAAIELVLPPGSDPGPGTGSSAGSGAGSGDGVVPPLVRSVPVSLPLTKLGVAGIAGDRAASRGLVRAMLGQAAALHSPRDLSIVVLAPGPEAGDAWRWVRWLPHTAGQDGQDCVALVGADRETVAARVAELVAEINRRREARENVGSLTAGVTAGAERNLLLVLDGARALRRVPGMPQILTEGPAVGVYALCLDDDERLLPEECQTVAGWQYPDLPGPDLLSGQLSGQIAGPHSGQRPARLTLRGGGLEVVGEVLADQVGVAWCERLARALAPVRDSSRDDGDAALPEAARLLDLLGMPDPTPDAIAAHWRRQAGLGTGSGTGMDVPVGYAASGVFHLDLRWHGPHGLIAGTTGAGKSELLQTLIASLAVANRPDELTFVLIDYKGGSAFAECARLPHTVGMVSDLDGHLTARALASLSAELKRREEILFQTGVKDLDDYRDARATQAWLEPLPRLILVIDEFASLVGELPEFVTGLVGIAQRGRSLGVHLVLATQRPAGVVSADIAANTNLRIALRVTDAGESTDVIGTPDAANIARSTPGRCYVRSGASSLTAVQAARVGGRRPGAHADAGPSVTTVDWTDLGRPPGRGTPDGGESDAETDLAVLVDAIRSAAEAAGVAAQRSPWLPALPATVPVNDLPEPVTEPPTEPVLPFGLADVPTEQARIPLTLDLAGGGHLLVAGSPRSGRSTVLRTIAGSVAGRTSPADVHLYGIDCGASALLPVLGTPHCGAVVTRDTPDRVDRLLGRLQTEVTRRQQLFAAQGASSLAEQRASAAPQDRLPWLVLLLDRWEGFTAVFESYDLGRLVETALRLLREGPAVGLRAVVTSDRSGLTGQISTVFDERLILRLADPNDWSLAGLSPRDVPTSLPPGRGLWLGGLGQGGPGTGALECQVALLDANPSGPAQTAALQTLGRQAGTRYDRPAPAQRPMRVDALPPRITTAETHQLDPNLQPPSPLWALIGVGGDELAPVGPDLLACSPGFVVAGPPRSGRSTVLATMARSLTERGIPVVLVTPRRSPLRTLATHPGVLGVLGAEDTPDRLRELTGTREQYVVLVDDAELLADTPLGTELETVVRQARDGEHALVAAGTTDLLTAQYRGFVVDTRRSRSGLLLAPQGLGTEGDLFSVRLPRNAGPGPAGRGLLILGGTITPIQAALP